MAPKPKRSCSLAASFRRRLQKCRRGRVEHCRAVGNRPMEGYAFVNLGYAHLRLGERAEALCLAQLNDA